MNPEIRRLILDMTAGAQLMGLDEMNQNRRAVAEILRRHPRVSIGDAVTMVQMALAD
jgi:hypothetical protein